MRLAGSLLLALLSIGAASADEWKPVLGAESVGLWTVAADPRNSSVLYADGAQGNQLWKSIDSGVNWTATALNFGLFISVIVEVARPAGVSVLYSDPGVQSIVRSIDGGVTATTRPVGNSLGFASGMAIDAERPDTLYVSYEPLCFGGCVRYGGVVRSTDGGRNWKVVLANVSVSDVLADPVTTGIVYAVTDSRGVLRSVDGGSTWNPMGPEQTAVVVIEPTAGMTLYLVGNSAMWRSDNRGDTWLPVAGRFPEEWRYYGRLAWSLVKSAVDPTNPSVIVVGAGAPYRSRDGGATWEALRDGLEDPYNPGEFAWGRFAYTADGTLWIASDRAGLHVLQRTATIPPQRRRAARH